MSKVRIAALILLSAALQADAQGRVPIEARSHITVLVDLSATWFSPASKGQDARVLDGVSSAITEMMPKLKAPVTIRYLEIGDASLSRPPLCEVRYSPNLFHEGKDTTEIADLDNLSEFLGNCSKIILMRKPSAYTDITGAINTVSRLSSSQQSTYDAVIVLSDFKEERRSQQKGVLGSLPPNTKFLMIYRVLEADRYDQTALDNRLSDWKGRLKRVGVTANAVDDISLEPAQLRRLLNQ